MTQTLEERIKQRANDIQVAIDDYNDTIHAIIGFANLYLLDEDFNPRPNVKCCQGRHLLPSSAKPNQEDQTVDNFVCPDVDIIIDDAKALLGEVQKNFPKADINRGLRVFQQVKKYDQELTGWPSADEKVQSHEIVLLVHLTTSAYAKDFYTEQLPKQGMTFERPFSIIEFGRFEQAQEFFLFRTVLGQPADIDGKQKLKYGIPVPMRVFLFEYAKAKLYDAQPPLPYLAELIWENIATPIAAENPKFEHLHSNQVIEVTLQIEEVVQKLHEGFSFGFWHVNHPQRQPRIPHTEWVKQACQFIIQSGDGKWIEGSNETKLVILYRKTYEDIKEHFIQTYAAMEEQKSTTPMLPGLELEGS